MMVNAKGDAFPSGDQILVLRKSVLEKYSQDIQPGHIPTILRQGRFELDQLIRKCMLLLKKTQMKVKVKALGEI